MDVLLLVVKLSVPIEPLFNNKMFVTCCILKESKGTQKQWFPLKLFCRLNLTVSSGLEVTALHKALEPESVGSHNHFLESFVGHGLSLVIDRIALTAQVLRRFKRLQHSYLFSQRSWENSDMFLHGPYLKCRASFFQAPKEHLKQVRSK